MYIALHSHIDIDIKSGIWWCSVLEFDDHHKNEYYRNFQKALVSSLRGMAESLISYYKARSSDQLFTSREGSYKAGIP